MESCRGVESPEYDEGREAGCEGGQGEAGQELGQEEGGAGVDTLPGLLVVPGASRDNCGGVGLTEGSRVNIHLHVMDVEMIAMK